jgi:hypothetical protein
VQPAVTTPKPVPTTRTTTTRTTTTTRKPRSTRQPNNYITPRIRVRTVQTYPPPPTTTTIYTLDRPAMRASADNHPYEIRRECRDFRLSSLPSDCCELPRMITPDHIVKHCNEDECIKAQHKDKVTCCLTQCKMAGMKIFMNDRFNPNEVVNAHLPSIRDEKVKSEWMPVLTASLNYCYIDQDSKIITKRFTTTTTKGSGMMPQMPQPTPTPQYQGPQPDIAMAQKQLTFCGIPVFVFKIMACMRARNFIGCPRFKKESEECVRKRNMMLDCGYELNYNF